jgi:hypothetical protein
MAGGELPCPSSLLMPGQGGHNEEMLMRKTNEAQIDFYPKEVGHLSVNSLLNTHLQAEEPR